MDSIVKRLGRSVSFFVVCISIVSCSLDDSELDQQIHEDDVRITQYLEENNISATKDNSGIYYEALRENADGKAVKTDDVLSLHYSIQTLEGNFIEQSQDSIPIFLLHNYQSLIPIGLDYGLQYMRNGEKFRFYIPSTLAYEGYGNADFFKANSIFIIDIEIEDILTKEEVYQLEMDSIESAAFPGQNDENNIRPGLFFKEIAAGTGSTPKPNSTVTINFTRKYLDGTIIEKTASDKPVTFQLNSGQAVKGLELGILNMREGGEAELIMTSELGFDESLQILPRGLRNDLVEEKIIYAKVEPFTSLIYEVELVNVM